MNAAAEGDISNAWTAGLEHVAKCPLCEESRRLEEHIGLQDVTFGTAPGTWTLYRCLGCSSMYLDPRPSADSIHLAYNEYYTHSAQSAISLSARQRLLKTLENGYRNHLYGLRLRPASSFGRLAAALLPHRFAHVRSEARSLPRCSGSHATLLDVGCGNGQFLLLAKQMGWYCHGVEFDAVAADLARQRGIEVIAAQVADLGSEYDGSFDVVTLSHVIEHLHEPMEVLRRLLRLLKPGGYVWLETPNAASVGYELYGRHWRGLEVPRHLVIFSPEALCRSLSAAGFERAKLLQPRDAAPHTFARSFAIQRGLVAERESPPLSKHDLQVLNKHLRAARTTVQRNPSRNEFLAAVAYRPSSP